MKNLSVIQESYNNIREMELDILRQRLIDFGGLACFSDDDLATGGTGTTCPMVVCNFNGSYAHSADVLIKAIEYNKNTDEFSIIGEESGDGQEIEVPIYAICFGELKWIINAIPERKTKKDGNVHILFGENACSWYAEEGINALIKHIDEDVWDAKEYHYSQAERLAYLQGVKDGNEWGCDEYIEMSDTDYRRLMIHTGKEQG